MKAEFDEITDVMWHTMDGVDPPHPIFFPTFGDGPDAKATAIAESKERIWNQHKNNPASHWIYVREESTGRVVAGCQWRIYDDNPFEEGPPTITAIWWPEGSVGRKFATEVVNQCYTPRTLWMARPHLGMHQSPGFSISACAFKTILIASLTISPVREDVFAPSPSRITLTKGSTAILLLM